MISNIDHIVYVYRHKTKPNTYQCLYHDDDNPSKAWVHVATINAAAWVEWLLNVPPERESHIKAISG